MKARLLFFSLILTITLTAQDDISGSIIDAKTGEAIAYANIGIVGQGIGTVSDDEGNFQLRLRERYDDQALRVSILGYASFDGKVSQFKKLVRQNKVIKLEPLSYDLQEIVVAPAFSKTKRFGNRAESKKLTDGFDGDLLGREGGIVVKLGERYRPGVITKFRAFVVSNPYKEIKFRLNFYKLRNGLPAEPLSRKSIIITSKIKNGVLEANLEDYNIVVDDDFAMTLEWIEDFELEGQYRMGGLRFAMRRFGPKCVFRYASQDNWDAYSGLLAPSPCMNVTIGYN